jgi:hypothetical protein
MTVTIAVVRCRRRRRRFAAARLLAAEREGRLGTARWTVEGSNRSVTGIFLC